MQESTEALEQELQTRFKAFMETNSELNAFIADINLMLEGTDLELIGFLLNPVEAILESPMQPEDVEFLSGGGAFEEFPEDWAPEWEVLGK